MTSRPLRKAMMSQNIVPEADAEPDKTRILVPISRETHEWLKKEAERGATSVSALCSMAILDWVDQRQHWRERLDKDMMGGRTRP